MIQANASKPGLGRLLLLSLVTIVICLLVIEFILAYLQLPVLTYVMQGVAYDLDVKTLYRITPNCRSDINSYGYRDQEFPPKSTAKPRILIYGDSFTIGLNVPVEATIPKILQKRLGNTYEVLNMGVYGYGPDQSYLRLIEEWGALKPDIVLLQLFPANDFNDLYKNKLLQVTSGGVRYSDHNAVTDAVPKCRLCIVVRKALTGHYLNPAKERELAVNLFRDTYDWDLIRNSESSESRMKTDLMKSTLKSMSRFLAARRVRFAIFVLPSFNNIQDPSEFVKHGIPQNKYFFAEDLVSKICEEEKIPCLNLAHRFVSSNRQDLFDPKDGHLTIKGNQFVATAIQNWLNDRNWP